VKGSIIDVSTSVNNAALFQDLLALHPSNSETAKKRGPDACMNAKFINIILMLPETRPALFDIQF